MVNLAYLFSESPLLFIFDIFSASEADFYLTGAKGSGGAYSIGRLPGQSSVHSSSVRQQFQTTSPLKLLG